jgi:hypothetical protein
MANDQDSNFSISTPPFRSCSVDLNDIPSGKSGSEKTYQFGPQTSGDFGLGNDFVPSNREAATRIFTVT